MSQKQVAGWLKGITLSIAGMGLLFFGLVVPYLAWDMAVTYPDYAAFVLAVVWFAGILFLAAKRALGPAFLIFMILLIFINVVIAVLAAALSHLIYKSYEMKQDAELTI